MKVKEFEAFVVEQAKYPVDDVNYSFIGLAGETGECMEWYKKVELRGGNKLTREDLKLELGDVLHYVTRIGHYYGWGLKEIMDANKVKLTARDENRKVI